MKNNTRNNQNNTIEFDSYIELKPYIARCLQLNHELSNPLTGIIGYCDFLLETNQNIPDELLIYIKQILTCAERMEKILKNLSEAKVKLNEKIDLPSFLENYK
jgi:signal transduction histidine kinase